MIFSLVVLSSPASQQGSQTALRFARAALAAGHQIYRVFFYHDGVHNGLATEVLPQDEHSIPEGWRQLQEQHGVDLVLCISASLRRGVLDGREAQRYQRQADTVRPGFALSGLGQWVDAALHADRTLTFA